jgi:hypothetical protein
MPEIFKDRKGCIVGAIVALPFGMYGVSVRAKLYGYQEDIGIVQKSFDRLDEARNWLSKASVKA